MDILYKGGALLAAQLEGAARLALAVPAAVLWNAAASTTTGASRSPASSSPGRSADAAAPSSGSRCPFSGLLGGAATCPGARMAAAAATVAAASAGPRSKAETAAATATAAAAGRGGPPAAAAAVRCWWVEGRVTHVRRRPARHAFAYDVRLALVDLDDPPAWFAAQRRQQAGGDGYLSAREARAAAGTAGRVLLLTLPAAAGYAQNPISVYYCYDAVAKEGQGEEGAGEGGAKDGGGGRAPPPPSPESPAPPRSRPPQQQHHQQKQEQKQQPQRLRRCIAEVTNTPWGERVSFVFDPRGAAVPKALHVSPFMDMRNVWLLRATDPLVCPGAAAAAAAAAAPPAASAAATEDEAAAAGGAAGGGNSHDASSTGRGSRVVLSVLVDHPELGRYFDAQFVGRAVAAAEEERGAAGGGAGAGGRRAGGDGRSERGGLRMLWRYGFLPQRVALWIYVHAVLLALKGVRVQPKPAAATYAARAQAALERMAAGGGGGGKADAGGRRAAGRAVVAGAAATGAAAAEGSAPPIPGGPGSGAGWAGRAFAWRPAPSWPWYLD